jgi:hypothetical protein
MQDRQVILPPSYSLNPVILLCNSQVWPPEAPEKNKADYIYRRHSKLCKTTGYQVVNRQKTGARGKFKPLLVLGLLWERQAGKD